MRPPSHAGVFHAGVVVYGHEFAFGGHEFDASGVFCTQPQDPPSMPNGGKLQHRECIYLGESDLTEQEVAALVQRMGQEYRGRAYHLLEKNCENKTPRQLEPKPNHPSFTCTGNHFAEDFAMLVSGKRIPGWINRLAHLAITLHCLLPKSWVPPLTKSRSRANDQEHQSLIGSMAPRSDQYRAPNEKGIQR